MSKKEINNIKIPDNHKRSLSVTARYIEKNINEIENLLNTKNDHCKTEHIIRNLSDNHANEILYLLKILKNQNEKFFEELQLKQNILYENRILIGKISLVWAILCDSTAEALKGYGNLTSSQADVINKHVNQMLDIVGKIQSVFKE
jgi:restriction endonuclease Mrr